MKFKLQVLRVGEYLVRATHNDRNLGVLFGADMTKESHVTTVCRSAMFYLRNISRMRQCLTAAVTDQVMHL